MRYAIPWLTISSVIALIAGCQTAPRQDSTGAVNYRIDNLIGAHNALASSVNRLQAINSATTYRIDQLANTQNDQVQLVNQMQATSAALSRQLQKVECLGRFNMVTSACLALYLGESNGIALQTKLAACIRSKGFPQGSDSCQ